jgi:putative phosphoribosyl transferase
MRIRPIFRDREHAGEALAKRVLGAVPEEGVLVLGLPRGGVPVGFAVARKLGAELDIFLVRKLGLPAQEELAIGAIASGGVRVLNELLVAELGLTPRLINEIAAREERELKRREELYRQGRPASPIRDRTVVIVDDGLATGASMKAAAQAVRLQGPKRIVVAVPLAAEQTCNALAMKVDAIICVYMPEPFVSVGIWYEDFSQTTDQEVQRLLREAARRSLSVH